MLVLLRFFGGRKGYQIELWHSQIALDACFSQSQWAISTQTKLHNFIIFPPASPQQIPFCRRILHTAFKKFVNVEVAGFVVFYLQNGAIMGPCQLVTHCVTIWKLLINCCWWLLLALPALWGRGRDNALSDRASGSWCDKSLPPYNIAKWLVGGLKIWQKYRECGNFNWDVAIFWLIYFVFG